MHKLGQAHIEIDGDTAHSESYAVTHHVSAAADGRDTSDYVIGIRYVDRFERRTDGIWRIADRQLRFEWQRVDALSQLDPSWTPGARGETDPRLCVAPTDASRARS